MSKRKELKGIKTSLFSRSLTLAKISINAGAKMAGHTLSQALQNQESKQESWRNFIKDQAQVLTHELGQLKGSLMKAGQMLSLYGEHFFPPEANQFLRSLQQDTPPVQWENMAKILKTHLGAKKVAELEVDPIAIGTASLGQVHKAKIKATGQIIALKIQYPNVDKAIDSDLRAIKSFLYLVKLLPKDFNTDPLFAEIREMLVQETDYRIEAELTQQYGELLKADSRFVVPKVFTEYSNHRVLATSFEEGLRVDDALILNLSQSRRNNLALSFMDLYFKEIFHWKLVQTDPHFGNYKIRIQDGDKDQIVLFDFGATRSYPETFMDPYQRMIKAMYYNDHPTFEAAAQELKLLKETDHPDLKNLFSEMCFELVEPFLHPSDPRNNLGKINAEGIYDWQKTDLAKRSSQKVIKLLRNFELRAPPREILFLDRKAAGVFTFLAHLKARINGRDLLESYLETVNVQDLRKSNC